MIHHKTTHLSGIRRAARMPDSTHIVIAGHNALARARLKKLCGALDFTNSVTEVDSLDALRAALGRKQVDLVLLGDDLYASAGLEAAQIIRTDPALPAPAIVLVTDTEHTEGAVQRTERGISACLALENLSLVTLQDTARTALRISRQTPDWNRVPDFSRRARGTQDLKPIVGRMMRQIRSLHELDRMDPLDVVDRIKQIEGSLHRLWTFLEILDDSSDPNDVSAPTIPAVRGEKRLLAASINARVPSERPAVKAVKPPSVFRRRPD